MSRKRKAEEDLLSAEKRVRPSSSEVQEGTALHPVFLGDTNTDLETVQQTRCLNEFQELRNEHDLRVRVTKCSHIVLKKKIFETSYEHHLLVSNVDLNEIEIIEYGYSTVCLALGSICKIQMKKMKYADFFVPGILNVHMVYCSEYPETDESKEAAIKRAKSRLGETSYNLAVNNCEHFVTWALTGKPICTQLRDTETFKTLIADIVPALISEGYKWFKWLLQMGLRILVGKNVYDCLQRVKDICFKYTRESERKTSCDALIQSNVPGIPEAKDSRISPKDGSGKSQKDNCGIPPNDGNGVSAEDESGLIPELELILELFLTLVFICTKIYIFCKEGEHTWREMLFEILRAFCVEISDVLPVSPDEIVRFLFQLFQGTSSIADFCREMFKQAIPFITCLLIHATGLSFLKQIWYKVAVTIFKLVWSVTGGFLFDKFWPSRTSALQV